MEPRVLATRCFAVSLLVYVATAGGSLATTDAVVAFDVTRNICEHGTMAMSGNLLGMEAHRGVDGRYYSPFGIAQSVYNIPFYLAGRAAQQRLGVRFGKADTIPKAAVAMGATVVAAACVALTALLALEVAGTVTVAVGAAVLFGLGTVFWPYAKFGFNAPLATCAVLAGVLFVVNGTRRRSTTTLAAAGLAFGVAMLTRHELAIVLVPVGLQQIVAARRSGRWTQPAALAAGFATGFITWMAVNASRFGDPFNPGYVGDPHPAFGSSILTGLYGLLFSPAGSLFLYCPLALLAVPAFRSWWHRDRESALLFAGIVVTLLFFYAQLGNWVGGRSYGPRYLVPALPFLAIPVAIWIWGARRRSGGDLVRRVALAICVLSVGVQLPGVLVDFSKVSVAWARQYRLGDVPDRRVEWRAAPLLLNTLASIDAVPRNVRYLSGTEKPPRIASSTSEGDRDFAQQFSFSLDLWWLYLFYLGAWPASVALLVGLLPLVIAAVIARPLIIQARGGRTATGLPAPRG